MNKDDKGDTLPRELQVSARLYAENKKLPKRDTLYAESKVDVQKVQQEKVFAQIKNCFVNFRETQKKRKETKEILFYYYWRKIKVCKRIVRTVVG